MILAFKSNTEYLEDISVEYMDQIKKQMSLGVVAVLFLSSVMLGGRV